MSLLRTLRRPPRLAIHFPASRGLASTNVVRTDAGAAAKAAPRTNAEPEVVASRSSCPEHTVLTGLAYLKDQPPVTALADDAYPEWLWSLLEPRRLPDDGPGGLAEKVRLRKQNRQRIRDQNFMKTQ